MAKVLLSQKLVNEATCLDGFRKNDLFDTGCRGLLLEVRQTGGKTYYLHYRNSRGVTKNFKLASAADVSLVQARELADKARNKIAMGIDPREEKAALKAVPTFEAFVLGQYLLFIKSYKKSWPTDLGLLRKHLLPRYGKRYLDEITRQDIVKLIHERSAEGAKPGTVNRVVIIMRYIFNLCIKWEVPGVTKNPTHGVALLEENNKKERYLSTEEAHRLYDAVCASSSKMLRYIVPMLILTGARKREVLDAKWEDFDLVRKSWRIPMSKSGKPRYVPLSENALNLLASVPRKDGCPYAFANPKTGLPYVSFFDSWDTARNKAGLADVRIHDLRHNFASLLVNNGRTLYEVQKILGHTQVKTTQRYAHLSPETLLDAVNVAGSSVAQALTPVLAPFAVNLVAQPPVASTPRLAA